MSDADPMLAFEEHGRGIPLVLLHGFPVDRRMWVAQIVDLSSVCRVIAIDLPGFGQSPRGSAASIEDFASAVYALLGSIKALPCVLAGWSMGGYTALALTRKHPDALRGLVLIDTKAAPDTEEQKAARGKMIDLAQGSGAGAIADQMVPKQIAEGTASSRPAVVRQLCNLMLACDPNTIANALAAMRDRRDQTDLLGTIRVPSLVIVGDSDTITPVAVAEAMKRQLVSARLAIIKGAGHASPIEQASQVNRALREFMQIVDKP
jgi:3-oxoadipate enol-lactonase